MSDAIAIDAPRWLSELRSQCKQSSQKKVAKKLGYSHAVINQVISNKYTGNLQRVAETVCSVYLGETVICPVLGELEIHRCRKFQKDTFAATNRNRVRLYRACRNGCINSEIQE